MILVMELYPKTLWNFLENQDLRLAIRLEIAIKLVKEIKRAHDGEVVHRDLKPTNIMVDANNELTLIDFGIGRSYGDLEGSCGTPGFTPPEQFSGDDQNEAVDTFSLGKNLALIFFPYFEMGWNFLYSSKNWITSQNVAKNKLAPFSDFFNIIRQMLQVKFKNHLVFLIILILTILNIFCSD